MSLVQIHREPSRVLLLRLDGGNFPNLALMRLSAHFKAKGAHVDFRRAFSISSVEPHFGDDYDAVFASTIFERTSDIAARLSANRPDAVIGGTGSGSEVTLEQIGIATQDKDYAIYPTYQHSIGFTQRGCRLKCGFCVVPKKEGGVRVDELIEGIWRGNPYPKNLVLLDNDFFGAPNWRYTISYIRDYDFRVSFNQGINVRMVDQEIAEAIASVRYSDDNFKRKTLYTAWDNRKDEARLFAGLNHLVKAGVKPDDIMVYMLCGYWPGETQADREYRRKKLRDFGQRESVLAYYLIAEEGSDPIVAQVLGVKKQQVEGIRRAPDEENVIEKLQNDGGHIRKLAEAYLEKKAEVAA